MERRMRRRRWCLRLVLSLVVVISVAGRSDAASPAAVDDTLWMDPSTSAVFDVLANDVHDGGLALELGEVGTPTPSGMAWATSDGTVLFTPVPGVIGDERFSYQACDEHGACSTATATVHVGTFILGPRGPSGLVATPVSPREIRLAWWDNSDDETSFHVLRGTSPGSLVEIGVLGANTGSLIAMSWTDTFPSDLAAGTAFSYRVDACNADGCAASNVAEVVIPEGPENQPPFAGQDRFELLVGSDLFVTFVDLLANDGPTDRTLEVVAVQGTPLEEIPASGLPTDQAHALLFAAAGGVVVHSLVNPNLLADTFSYTVSDGEQVADGQVDLVFLASVAVNACADSYTTSVVEAGCSGAAVPSLRTTEGRPLFIRYDSLTANDSGSPLNMTTLNFTRPSHGRLEFCCGPDAASAGSVNPPVGVWFVPDDEYTGEDSFYYSIYNNGSFDSAAVTIQVAPDNQSPDPTVAMLDQFRHYLVGASPRTVLTFSDLLLGFDPYGVPTPDLGDNRRIKLQFYSQSGPGTLSWIAPDRQLGEVPPSWYEGALQLEGTQIPNTVKRFDYELHGAGGPQRAHVWITFTDPTQGTNPPALRAVNDLVETYEGKRLDISYYYGEEAILANDYVQAGANGLVPELAWFGRPWRGEFLKVHHPATISYRAPRNYVGIDHFVYAVRSTSLPEQVSLGRVVVKVLPGAPVAVADAAQTNKGQPVVIAPLANDSDPNSDALRIESAGAPGHGFVELGADGQTITYSPAIDFLGSDSFTYTVTDTDGNLASAQVVVTVVNAPPVAIDDQVRLGPFQTILAIAILANDYDPDGGALTVVRVDAATPAGGQVVLNADGTVVVTYDKGAPHKADEFSYVVRDDEGAEAEATVQVLPAFTG
jgi:large repetitive protein